MGTNQVEGCDVVGISETAPLPGNVYVEAFAWPLACVIHFPCARVEAIPPAKQVLSCTAQHRGRVEPLERVLL